MLKETESGVIIPVKVSPKSHKNEVLGWDNGELRVKLIAAPQKGEANHALMDLLADRLQLPRSTLTLIYGATSRHKRVHVAGVTVERLVQLLPLVQTQIS